MLHSLRLNSRDDFGCKKRLLNWNYDRLLTIHANLSEAVKKPVKITPAAKSTPLKITMPGPVPYVYEKSIPWNYGGDIYYHGIKQVETIE